MLVCLCRLASETLLAGCGSLCTFVQTSAVCVLRFELSFAKGD